LRRRNIHWFIILMGIGGGGVPSTLRPERSLDISIDEEDA
jgi:hypothetical protein